MARRAILAAGAWLALAWDASAGAWTRAAGDGFASQTVRVFSTELTSEAEPPFRKFGGAGYLEYGLYDGVTIGGELEYARRGDGTEEGLIRGFLRLRLWEGDGQVLSAEFGGAHPTITAISASATARDVTAEGRVGLAYGRGFSLGAGAWGEAALTFRRRDGPPADEMKLDLTFGYRPTDRHVLVAQAFGTMGLRNHGPFGADYDALKLSILAGWRLSESRTLLIGVAQDVWGRNLDLGTEASVVIWSEF